MPAMHKSRGGFLTEENIKYTFSWDVLKCQPPKLKSVLRALHLFMLLHVTCRSLHPAPWTTLCLYVGRADLAEIKEVTKQNIHMIENKSAAETFSVHASKYIVLIKRIQSK